jgi:RHS repeat-associated protein
VSVRQKSPRFFDQRVEINTYHFHYDGNGNVTEITDLSGNPAASYRYDAFGNTLTSTGAYADQNRYRFSTKPLDSEVTNAPLYYYGYRYYDPMTGRWLSRDPIGEAGGVNLYAFVGNSSPARMDYLGKLTWYCDAEWAWFIKLAGEKESEQWSSGFGQSEDKTEAMNEATDDAKEKATNEASGTWKDLIESHKENPNETPQPESFGVRALINVDCFCDDDIKKNEEKEPKGGGGGIIPKVHIREWMFT